MLVRVFYAHSSATDPQELREQAGKLLDTLQARFKARGVSPDLQVVLGREDHRRHWCGNWDAWQDSIISRQDFMTGQPVYSLFIVPDSICGRATAGIIRQAIAAQRSVMWWDGKDKLQKVHSIEMDDPDNWTSGFRVEIQPPNPQGSLNESA